MRHRRRHEPFSRFILTMGVADMVIGGVGDRLSLLLLGLTTAGVGLLIRWARLQKRQSFSLNSDAPKALPAASEYSGQARRYRERRIY